MVRVVFNDSNKIHKCEFDITEEYSVKLTGQLEENTSGFKVFRSNGDILGDYSDYRCIKEKTDNYLLLTKEENL